jgi:hypothetical protein
MVFEKRGRWCVRVDGRLHKFGTKAEAEAFAGPAPAELTPFEAKEALFDSLEEEVAEDADSEG